MYNLQFITSSSFCSHILPTKDRYNYWTAFKNYGYLWNLRTYRFLYHCSYYISFTKLFGYMSWTKSAISVLAVHSIAGVGLFVSYHISDIYTCSIITVYYTCVLCVRPVT